MMKKLLVVLAVLVLTVSANAGIYNPGQYIDVQAPEQVNVGDVFTVNVVVGAFADLASFSGSADSLAQMTVTNGIVSAPVINSSAGWADLPTPLITTDGSVLSIEAGVGTTAIAKETLLFSFTVEAGAAGTLVIDSSAGNWAGYAAVAGPYDGFNAGTFEGDYPTYTAGYKEIAVVPEPITVALLGLGGLFIRRRK